MRILGVSGGLGEVIDSNSYRLNDRAGRNGYIMQASAREFDYAKTPMSKALLSSSRAAVDAIYAQYASLGNQGNDFNVMDRMAVDSLVSLAMGIDYEEAVRDHDYYMGMFMGEDVTDRSFLEAVWDMANTNYIQQDLAQAQIRLDRSRDEAEIARLEREVMKYEREIVKSMDYSDRGWLGNNLVQASPVIAQRIEQLTWMAAGALVLGGIGVLVGAPTTAGALVAGSASGGLAGAGAAMYSVPALATLGTRAGDIAYSVGIMNQTEKGMYSNQLMKMVDENGNRLTGEQRDRISTIKAFISSAIEIISPDFAFGTNTLVRSAVGDATANFLRDLGNAGIQTLMETGEEALQSGVGELFAYVAQEVGNRAGNTAFEKKTKAEQVRSILEETVRGGAESLFASALVSGGAIFSTGLLSGQYSNRLPKGSPAPSPYVRIQNDPTEDAINASRQVQERGDADVRAEYMVFKPERPTREYTSVDEETGETRKLPPIKVRVDEGSGRFVPIDAVNADIAKSLYDQGAESFSIEIVEEEQRADTRATPAESSYAEQAVSAMPIEETGDAVVESVESLNRMASELRERGIEVEMEEDGRAFLYTVRDADGNERISVVEVDESMAPIADEAMTMEQWEAAERLDVEAAGLDIAGSDIPERASTISDPQTTEEAVLRRVAGEEAITPPSDRQPQEQRFWLGKADPQTANRIAVQIYEGAGGAISKRNAKALGNFYAALPASIRERIEEANGGRLVIREDADHQLKGERGKSLSDSLQIVLGKDSDPSTFVHEMVHIIGFTIDGAFSDVVRELKSALSADGDRQSVLAFLDENSRITGMSMEEAVNAIESMDDSGNLTRMQEELVASMIEADGRYDRSEATTLLPAPLRKILDSIRSMISSVYKGLTGYNRLPENVRDAFVDFFFADAMSGPVPSREATEMMQQANRTITPNEKDLTHLTKDAWERKKMSNMPNDTLSSMLDGNVFVPEYALEQKLRQVEAGGTHPDPVMERRIRRELSDRDAMFAIPNEDKEWAVNLSDTEFEQYLATEKKDLSEESKGIYRKMHAYAHTPTGREIINSFKARYGTREGIIDLRNRLAARTVTYTTKKGNTATRKVVLNTVPAAMLRAYDGSDAAFREIQMSMDSSPAMWLRTYATLFPTEQAMMNEFGIRDRKVLDAYVQMSDRAFDFVRVVARDDTGMLGEFDDSDITMLYDPDIANQSDMEATDRDILDGAKVSKLWDRIKNDPKAIKGELRQMAKSLDLMSKKIQSLREEFESLRTSDARKLARTEEEYEARLRSNADYQQGLRDRMREGFERERQGFRDRISAEKQKERLLKEQIHGLENAYRRALRWYNHLAVKSLNEKIDRGLKRRLRFVKSSDAADIQDSLFWIYGYMHDGKVSSYISEAERGKDADISIESMMEGGDVGNQDDVYLYQLDRDGNPIDGTTPYMGNLGAYSFDRTAIPEALRKNLSETAIADIASQKDARWRGLKTSTKRELLESLILAKKESKDKLEAAKARRREYLRNDENAMAAAAFSSSGKVFELTDEMWDMYLEDHKRTHATRENTTETQVMDYFRRHPERFMKPVEKGFFAEKADAIRTAFSFIEPMCRMLDGKERGAFYQALVQRPREAYNRMLSNIDRRKNDLDSLVSKTLGAEGTPGRKRSVSFLKSKIDITTNETGHPAGTITGQEAWGAYIYSQNILSFAKLWNASGNSISLMDLGRINPVDTLKWIELELQIRAMDDAEDARRRDLGLKEIDRTSTVLQGENIGTLNEVREYLQGVIDRRRSELGLAPDAPVGRFSLIVPENIRQAGDGMIDLFHGEQDRMVQVAYSEYNMLLDFQDRYFPFETSSRPGYGNILGLFKSRKPDVNSGSIKVRQKDAMYPLLLDPISVMSSAISTHEQLINMSRTIKDLNSMLGEQGGIGEVVRNRYGNPTVKFLNDYVGWLAGSKDKLTDGEKVMNKVFGNLAISKIGLNFMTTIKQLAALIPALSQGEISVADWAGVVLSSTGIGKLSALESLVRAKDPSVLRGSVDWNIDRLRQQASPDRSGIAARALDKVLMGMIDGTEKWLRSTVWYASYQKSIAAGKSEREAIDIASSLVHRTQSVTDPFSMSQLQARRDPLTRLALMFTTDLFHYWNIIYGDIFYDIKQKNWRKAVSRSLGVLSSAALMAFLSGKGLPDDEDDEPFEIDEYLKEFMVNGIQYLVPIAGSKIPNQINGYSSAFSTLPQDIWQAGSMIYNSVTGNRTYSPDEYVAQVYDVLAGGVSAVFPFPQVAVSRLPRTFWDNEEGFTFNPGYLFGTSYGRAWDAIGIMEALQ